MTHRGPCREIGPVNWHDPRSLWADRQPQERFGRGKAHSGPVAPTGNRMTDKNRHRPMPAPKGHMPNWALALCLASGFALVALARSIG